MLINHIVQRVAKRMMNNKQKRAHFGQCNKQNDRDLLAGYTHPYEEQKCANRQNLLLKIAFKLMKINMN